MERQEKLIVFLSLFIVFLDYKAFMPAPVNNFVFVQCIRRQIVFYFLECLPVCSIFSLRSTAGNPMLRIPHALHA